MKAQWDQVTCLGVDSYWLSEAGFEPRKSYPMPVTTPSLLSFALRDPQKRQLTSLNPQQWTTTVMSLICTQMTTFASHVVLMFTCLKPVFNVLLSICFLAFFQSPFTFSMILYQFQVCSIVVGQSCTLQSVSPWNFHYPPGTVHSYYIIIGYISYAVHYIPMIIL